MDFKYMNSIPDFTRLAVHSAISTLWGREMSLLYGAYFAIRSVRLLLKICGAKKLKINPSLILAFWCRLCPGFRALRVEAGHLNDQMWLCWSHQQLLTVENVFLPIMELEAKPVWFGGIVFMLFGYIINFQEWNRSEVLWIVSLGSLIIGILRHSDAGHKTIGIISSWDIPQLFYLFAISKVSIHLLFALW